MGGVRWSTIHFEQLPAKEAVKQGLNELTGLLLCFDEETEGMLGVIHPTHQKVAATLCWVDKKTAPIPKELESLNINIDYREGPCEGWSRYVVVEFEVGNIDYVEKSSLYLLIQMGGRSVGEVELPVWAGKKWLDVWPRTYLGQFKALWRGWTRGTLFN